MQITINDYLIANGEYVYDSPPGTPGRQRIIASSTTYTINRRYSSIGHAVRRDIKYVRNFIIDADSADSYYLSVNNRFVGRRYATVDDAVSVLYGIYTRCSGSQAGIVSSMEKALDNGSSIPASGPVYLQEITWNMTGRDTATIGSSTGLNIISNTKTTQLIIGNSPAGQPRLWNGLEADNYGATNGAFPDGTACRTWWDNYGVEVRVNGGPWESLGSPVQGGTQATYVNTTGSFSYSNTDYVNGDVVDFRVSQFVPTAVSVGTFTLPTVTGYGTNWTGTGTWKGRNPGNTMYLNANQPSRLQMYFDNDAARDAAAAVVVPGVSYLSENGTRIEINSLTVNTTGRIFFELGSSMNLAQTNYELFV